MGWLALVFTLLLTAGGAVAQQATVYKTVDEEGVVSFSDTPPANEAQVETVLVDAPPPQTDGVYQHNLEAMRETTDRLAEDRMAREKHRAELREMAARTDAYTAPEVIEVEHYSPLYTSGRYYRHDHYPPLRPRPPSIQPIPRPPLRPRPPVTQPARPTHNNTQLMRPITSR